MPTPTQLQLATEILQLAMSIPSEVADVVATYSAVFGSVTVTVYLGGWMILQQPPSKVFSCVIKGDETRTLQAALDYLRTLSATPLKSETV